MNKGKIEFNGEYYRHKKLMITRLSNKRTNREIITNQIHFINFHYLWSTLLVFPRLSNSASVVNEVLYTGVFLNIVGGNMLMCNVVNFIIRQRVTELFLVSLKQIIVLNISTKVEAND